LEAAKRYIPSLNLVFKGRKYWACCPLHSEHTPSFMIDPIKDRWKCFGCGDFGDSIDLVGKVLGVTIAEANKLIAEDLGLIGVEDSVKRRERLRRQKEEARQRKVIRQYEAAVQTAYNGLREIEARCKERLQRIKTSDLNKPEIAALIELKGNVEIVFDMLLDDNVKKQLWAIKQYERMVNK